MIDLKRAFTVAALILLGFAGWSQLSEDHTVESVAGEAACRGHECRAEPMKKKRELFGWKFTYATYGENARVVDVTCGRALWLFGPYHCDVTESDAKLDDRFRP